jgi:hypothetical protein
VQKKKKKKKRKKKPPNCRPLSSLAVSFRLNLLIKASYSVPGSLSPPSLWSEREDDDAEGREGVLFGTDQCRPVCRSLQALRSSEARFLLCIDGFTAFERPFGQFRH